MLKKFLTFMGVFALTCFAFDVAMAGQPTEWAMGFQEAATPTKERMEEFHNMLLYVIFGIAIFVLLLLIYVVLRFNSKVNPEPSTVTHNVTLEIAWTIIPVIILLIIAVPSFKLLYYADRIENPDMTIKVTGYQWYWGYQYPDHGDIEFSSYMVSDDEIDTSKGQVRLLSTDNPVVVPVNKNIQVILTAGDVLHSWAVPALGVKQDTVPGKLTETWFRITKPGVYYGQCSELCGKDHGFMPVEIHAVSEEEFASWVQENGGSMPEIETSMNLEENAESSELMLEGETEETQDNQESLNTTAEGEE